MSSLTFWLAMRLPEPLNREFGVECCDKAPHGRDTSSTPASSTSLGTTTEDAAPLGRPDQTEMQEKVLALMERTRTVESYVYEDFITKRHSTEATSMVSGTRWCLQPCKESDAAFSSHTFMVALPQKYGFQAPNPSELAAVHTSTKDPSVGLQTVQERTVFQEPWPEGICEQIMFFRCCSMFSWISKFFVHLVG